MRRGAYMNTRAPSREGVLHAASKVAEILPPTPLLPLEIAGARCWAKAESLPPIRAFKIRGAWHRLTELTDEQRSRRVIEVSSGNHAQGVAWAARKLGIAATIVMPRDAPAVKLDRTCALGGDVVLYDRANEDRDAIAEALVGSPSSACPWSSSRAERPTWPQHSLAKSRSTGARR